jgi:hypothetical protein
MLIKVIVLCVIITVISNVITSILSWKDGYECASDDWQHFYNMRAIKAIGNKGNDL